MLIAQAQAEQLALGSYDPAFGDDDASLAPTPISSARAASENGCEWRGPVRGGSFIKLAVGVFLASVVPDKR